jgi:hypothetical protein
MSSDGKKCEVNRNFAKLWVYNKKNQHFSLSIVFLSGYKLFLSEIRYFKLFYFHNLDTFIQIKNSVITDFTTNSISFYSPPQNKKNRWIETQLKKKNETYKDKCFEYVVRYQVNNKINIKNNSKKRVVANWYRTIVIIYVLPLPDFQSHDTSIIKFYPFIIPRIAYL